MWLTHQEFPQLLNQMWNDNPSLMEAIDNFTNLVQIWNKGTFGNIFYKKNNITTRLAEIQKSPNYPTSNFLQELEK